MKIFNRIFILIFIATSILACGEKEGNHENHADGAEVSSQDVQVVDYAIEGMVCAMGCAATIEKDVAGIEGVIVSDVDYEAEKAHFEFDPAITSEKEIIAKIESIADGQYKVKEWVEKEVTEDEAKTIEEDSEVEGEEESVVNVSLPSFEIPNLFTLLLNQL